MQSAFNDMFPELFVEGFDEYMHITIDDDKMHDDKIHYQAKKINTQGLIEHNILEIIIKDL
jgi:hypothetical protein